MSIIKDELTIDLFKGTILKSKNKLDESAYNDSEEANDEYNSNKNGLAEKIVNSNELPWE